MKKNNLCLIPRYHLILIEKIPNAMKLTFFFLITSLFTITAKASAQRVSMSLNNVKVEKILSTITKQTGLSIAYSKQIVNLERKVSIQVEDTDVSQVLEKLVANTNLSYEIKNNKIYLFEKQATTAIPITTQQKKQISGKIVDQNGEPIIGVNVVVKGSTTGTVTDFEGKYVLEVPDQATLQVSYIGYLSQDIPVGKQKEIHICLVEDTQALDEVVVVGYGTQKKVNLTGAVATADKEILENRPIGNIAQGLQGAIPNLNIDFASGDPTSAVSFNVRGGTSINGGDALVLVDGVETSDLSILNPQDVETISVLKDAASASIYGARAAFGVVLITTKNGSKNQKIRVNYNNNFSWSKVSNLPNSVQSDKWIRAINQQYSNSGNGDYFSKQHVQAVDNFIAGKGPSAFPATDNSMTGAGQWAYAGNTNWFDEMYQPAFMQQHNASLTGGTEKNSYYASLGYKGQDGVLAYGTDKYHRINMAFNFTTQVTKWLELTFRTKYNRNTSDQPYTPYMDSPFAEIYRSFPIIPMYLPDGENFAGIAGSNFNYNICGRMAQSGRDKINVDDFWYTVAFNLTPFKGLSIKGDYTGNKFYKEREQHKKILTQIDPNGSARIAGNPNSVNKRNDHNIYQALNLWAEYKHTFKEDHNMGIMIGYNQESKKANYIAAQTSDLFSNDLPILDMANTHYLPDEEKTIWAVQGAFFRLNYDYKQRYLVEVNGRYDGSSKYMSGNRWGFFPSFSAGWRISEEDFFKPARSIVDNLKLRVSYGELGNQVTDGNFQYLSFLNSQNLNYIINGQAQTGLTAPTLASSNITWEKVKNTNFGLDWTILQGRFSGSFEYYIRNTQDMVVRKTYPLVLGTDGGKENLANMRTNGWELSLTWNDRIKDIAGSPLDYSIGLGISDNTSTITKYDNPTKSLDEPFYEGKKIGEIWGYVTDGFIKDQQEAELMTDRQGYISNTWIPGDIRYTDLNNDNKIDEGNRYVGDSGDKKVIGNNTPRYNFNFNLGASWKGLDLRLFFQGTMKRDIWIGHSALFWGYADNLWQQNLTDYHIDNSWSPENPTAYYPVPVRETRSRQVQSKYLQNGAFIRLKDVTLSYTLPKSFITNLGLEQCKIYVSGANLWEATKLFKYIDPDIFNKRKANGDLSAEAGGKIYPFTRSYSLGINVTF